MRKQVGVAPVNSTDAVTKAYVDSHDMGPGGAIGAPLLKNSATDYDDKWGTGFETVHYGAVQINASDAVTTYLFGITQNFLTNAQASSGGWPCGSNYCQILTVKTQDPAGFAISQFCMSDTNGTTFNYYRSGNNSGWSPWQRLDGPPSCAGIMNVSLSAAATGYVDVVFPTGLFTNPPSVNANCEDGNYICACYNRTTTGARVFIHHYKDTTATATKVVSWQAVGP